MEPLERLLAAHPGFLRGRGSCPKGPRREIRAGWRRRESTAASWGQLPGSGCSQSVQSVPGAGRVCRGLAAGGEGPAGLGNPQEAHRDGGQEAVPRAAVAACPTTCADPEKHSPGPAAAGTPGPGRAGSPTPGDPTAVRGCAPNPAARAAHGEERLRGTVLPRMDNSKQHQPLYQTRVPAAVPEPGLLQPPSALRLPLRFPWSPLRGGHSR